MPRYRLRTLQILLAIGPPVLAGAWRLNLTPVVAAVAVYAILVAILLCS